MTRWMLAAAATALLAACSDQPQPAEPETESAETVPAPADETTRAEMEERTAEPSPEIETSEAATAEVAPKGSLAAIIASPDRADDSARDQFRHPQATLEFFGVEPDMTVAEVLPGGGWYTRILLPYLAEDGRYVALNYQPAVWEEMYGDAWDEAAQAEIAAWPETAPESLAGFGPVTADEIDAYMLGSIPDSENGQGDMVLMIRALHHLNRFDVANLETALADIHEFLKPGGIVGVVQHRANADAPDEYATGDKGYLRQTDVISEFERAGFELVEQSEINANPADTADYEEGVWALPPSTTEGERAEIGESDRMTLKFRKPEA